MNQQLQHKVIYIGAIVVLLFPLFLLSQPATTRSSGGKLAELRKKYELSQAQLGMIDPTSASMKLATFGLHGVAANVLWDRAIDFKQKGDFANFDATLQQITYLQPHFYKVWDYQGHNVAFNISVEFDDYRDRYRSVTKGFDLMRKGISYNQKESRLLRSLAFFLGFKIGKSDERNFFRPMFANDEKYHAPKTENHLLGTRYEGRPESLRDNWLVSKWWYQQAEKLFDGGEIQYGTMNPFLIHSDAPMQQIQYAQALEDDGHFGETAKQAWQTAGEEWLAYGRLPIRTTRGFPVKLEDYDKNLELREQALKDLEALEPGIRERLLKEEIANLDPETRAAVNKDPEERTPEEGTLVWDARGELRISPLEIALGVDEKHRDEALKLAERYEHYDKRFQVIKTYRNYTMNYNYWKQRCETEQLDQLVEARKTLYDARQYYLNTDMPAALKNYELGFDQWRTILDKYPELLDEETFLIDMKAIVEDYQDVLAQVNPDGSRVLPGDFVLPDWQDKWLDYTRKQMY